MRKIIADSSANQLSLSGAAFRSIPMVIHAGERDFLDNAQLDTGDMMDYLSTFKGRSGTAVCPAPTAPPWPPRTSMSRSTPKSEFMCSTA